MSLALPQRLNKWAPILVALGAALVCFFQLGDHGLRMWDETRHGEAAWQMLQRGDYIDYYYDGQRDDWLAKPPLGIWLIALSYKLIGFTEWGLRAPSALAGVGIILLTYFLVRLYRGVGLAFLSAMIVMLCRGIVGQHVARTGDLDAVYILAAMAMIYLLQLAEVKHQRLWLPFAAVCGGLCFLTKGFMMGLFLPGLGLYVLLSGRAGALIRDWLFWLAVVLFAGLIGGWYLVVKKLGTPFVNSTYGADSWDVMVNYDIFRRFTEKIEGDNTTPFFLLEALDTRFGPWLYLLLILLLMIGWQQRTRLTGLWHSLRNDRLLLLSISMSVPTCVLFAVSATKFNWYVAITVPFLAILTVLLTDAVAKHRPRVWLLFGLFTVVGLVAQVQYMLRPEEALSHQVLKHLPELKGATHIYAERQPAYNTVLALKWRERKVELAPVEVLQRPRQIIGSKIDRIDEGTGSYSLLLRPSSDE